LHTLMDLSIRGKCVFKYRPLRKTKRTVALALLIAAIVAALSSGLAQVGGTGGQAAVFQVHPEKTVQTMTGFGVGYDGGSLKWMNAIAKPSDRERAYDLMYGDKGLRLNMMRLTIPPDALPEVDPPISRSLRYNWGADQAVQSEWQVIQPVLKRIRPTIVAVPFSAPARWKTNHQLTHGGEVVPMYYQDYAEYLADFLDYYHKNLKVDIDVLSMQNEPDVPAPWNSTVWNPQQMHGFLKVLAPAVRGRGLNTRFALSEGTSWTGAWARIEPTLLDPATRSWLSVMATHSYGPPEDKGRELLAHASGTYGLPVWMTEMSFMIPPAPDDPTMKTAILTAQFLHRDLVEGRASAWSYCFAIFDPEFQGSLGVFSPATPQGALGIPKRFWAMANYSHFVQPGWKLMQIDSPVYFNTGFVSPDGNRFVIVAINAMTSPRRATYYFNNQTISQIDAYCTSASLDLAPVTPPASQPHEFTAELPPISITTFVGELAHPISGPPQPAGRRTAR
jgi:O-glycosyl hydrolase